MVAQARNSTLGGLRATFYSNRPREAWRAGPMRHGTHYDQDAATPNDRGMIALLDEQLGKEPGFLAGFAFKSLMQPPPFSGGWIRSPTDAFFSCASRLNIDRV